MSNDNGTKPIGQPADKQIMLVSLEVGDRVLRDPEGRVRLDTDPDEPANTGIVTAANRNGTVIMVNDHGTEIENVKMEDLERVLRVTSSSVPVRDLDGDGIPDQLINTVVDATYFTKCDKGTHEPEQCEEARDRMEEWTKVPDPFYNRHYHRFSSSQIYLSGSEKPKDQKTIKNVRGEEITIGMDVSINGEGKARVMGFKFIGTKVFALIAANGVDDTKNIDILAPLVKQP